MFYQLNLTQNKLDFIHSHYKEQINALEIFYPIINKAIQTKNPHITFGGGTALAMYYFGHRLSFDIDLFVNDIQYMKFLSPKLWINEDFNFNDRYIEQAHHII